MQSDPTCTQDHVFLDYISLFFVLRHFLLIFVFFECLCSFSFRSYFLILRLLFRMLRLEFYVNQVGFKRHHWSTSSWLTAPPQPISWRGAVTSLECASLAVDAQRSLVQVEMDYCQLGNIFPYKTPLYVFVCHCCAPAVRSVNIKRIVLATCHHYVHLYLSAYGHILKGNTHYIHRSLNVTVIWVPAGS